MTKPTKPPAKPFAPTPRITLWVPALIASLLSTIYLLILFMWP